MGESGEPREGHEGVERHNLELNVGANLATSSSVAASHKETFSLASLTEFLDLDDRPSLILDLEGIPSATLIYHNASLGELKCQEVEVGRQVVDAFGKGSNGLQDRPFLEWAQSTNELFPSITYHDVRWTSKTIRRRWRVVSGRIESLPNDGRRQSISLDPPRLPRQSTAPIQPRMPITSYPTHRSFDAQLEAFRFHRDRNIPIYPPPNSIGATNGCEPLGRFDMTCPKPNLPITSFMEFFKAFDWGSTAVGPIDQWSSVLRRMCNFMMLDPRPAAIYYGKNKTTIYNESYVIVTGQRHPYMLGKSFSQAWPEVQEWFLPEFDGVCKCPFLPNYLYKSLLTIRSCTAAAASGKAFVQDNARVSSLSSNTNRNDHLACRLIVPFYSSISNAMVTSKRLSRSPQCFFRCKIFSTSNAGC